MNNTLKHLTLAVLSLLLCLAPAYAQTALTSTTLAAAIADTSSTTFLVASATGFAANYTAYVDREALRITAVNGLVITAVRGADGTRATKHPNAATIYVGPSYYFTTFERSGTCVSTDELVLPVINIQDGVQYTCDAGTSTWKRSLPTTLSALTITGIKPAAAASATAAADVLSVTGGVGGAQSATTSGGAAGGRVTLTGGVGGAGGSSSGTGGTGGALLYVAGAGGGTVTGGTGGLATLGAGAGGAGSGAGGTGGGLNLYSGVAGSGGTGTDGAINIRQGGAAATAEFAVSTAGATTIKSVGTNQAVTITPSGSGTTKMTGGTDPTKIVSVDPSGMTTAKTATLAFANTLDRTYTFPDAAITVSGATATDCGVAAGACSATTVSSTVKFVFGTATSTSASPSTVAITGMPAFTSTATYKCNASNATTATNDFTVLTAGYVSTTAVTFTGPNTLTDVIRWYCIGY